MRILITRFMARTPSFFRKVQALAGGVAAVSGMLLSLKNPPGAVADKLQIIEWAAGAVAIVCQFTVHDSAVLEKKSVD